MRFKQVGNKYDAAFIVVRNSGAVDIPLGAPIFFVMNGTNDGIDIVNAQGAGVSKAGLYAGVAVAPSSPTSGVIAAGGYGEAQVFGLCQQTRVITATRADSTNTYNSFTAIVVGDALAVNTVSLYDGFTRSAAGAASVLQPLMVAAQAYTSTASQSSSFDTTSRTAIVSLLKTFVRAM